MYLFIIILQFTIFIIFSFFCLFSEKNSYWYMSNYYRSHSRYNFDIVVPIDHKDRQKTRCIYYYH